MVEKMEGLVNGESGARTSAVDCTNAVAEDAPSVEN